MVEFAFHPAAKEAIDRKASELIAGITDYPMSDQKDPFTSQRHVALTLMDSDLPEDSVIAETDQVGKTIGRRFIHGDKFIGLYGNAYSNLQKLVAQLKKTDWIDRTLSSEFLEEQIFEWCRQSYISQGQTSLVGFVTEAAVANIFTYRLLVPLYGVEIPSSFDLGPFHFEPITASMIDELTLSFPDGQRWQELTQELKQEYQGLTATVTSIRAERRRATEFAWEQADFAASLLRLFSLSMVCPDVICACAPLGSEYAPTVQALVYREETANLYRNTQYSSLKGVAPWQIPQSELDHIRGSAIGKCVCNLFPDPTSQFAGHLRTALLTYSRSLTFHNFSDRLTFAISALEILLHKSDTEDIQQNIAERIAFMVTKSGSARRGVIKNFKTMYAMRSRYVHHGAQPADTIEFTEFLKNAWAAISSACNFVHRCPTKADFLEAIDQIKFGPN
jgi:Apea-like HEPN